MEPMTSFELVIAVAGVTLSLAASAAALLSLRGLVDRIPANPEAVARLVRSAPKDWLQNVLPKGAPAE